MKLFFQIRNQTVIIDEEDKGLFESRNWHLVPARQLSEKYYVSTSINGKTVYLHRLIMSAQKGQLVDHINKNTLDCTRENLRILTPSENRINSTVRANKKHLLPIGVYYKGRRIKRFAAAVNIDGKKVWLGYFSTEHEASQAYQRKISEIYPGVAV